MLTDRFDIPIKESRIVIREHGSVLRTELVFGSLQVLSVPLVIQIEPRNRGLLGQIRQRAFTSRRQMLKKSSRAIETVRELVEQDSLERLVNARTTAGADSRTPRYVASRTFTQQLTPWTTILDVGTSHATSTI
jgi:hypothetical protein